MFPFRHSLFGAGSKKPFTPSFTDDFNRADTPYGDGTGPYYMGPNYSYLANSGSRNYYHTYGNGLYVTDNTGIGQINGLTPINTPFLNMFFEIDHLKFGGNQFRMMICRADAGASNRAPSGVYFQHGGTGQSYVYSVDASGNNVGLITVYAYGGNGVAYTRIRMWRANNGKVYVAGYNTSTLLWETFASDFAPIAALASATGIGIVTSNGDGGSSPYFDNLAYGEAGV